MNTANGFDLENGKVFIIAELSANHGHSLQTALATVRAAKDAGADAIKIQTYTPDTITLDCDNEYFQIKQGTIWDGTTLYKLYQKAYTPWEWHKAIQDEARHLGLVFFSTPFDISAVDFLETLQVPMYKIASFEINDIPLIEYAASKGKPMILSTGVATLGEIADAVTACRRKGNNSITLLKCTSAYPASIEDANLATMMNLRNTFNTEIGLSDHTIGSTVAVTAVAMGAKVIEKHFIMDKAIGGPDASFSMEPDDFTSMVKAIRDTAKAIGKVSYPTEADCIKGRAFMRSLFAVKNIKAGEEFTKDNVRSIRPSDGISPKYYHEVLGKRARYDITFGSPISWKAIE